MGNDFFELEKNGKGQALGIGKNCQITDAILDKNVRIGNGVSIVNRKKIRNQDGDNYCIRDGIVIIPKAAVIPDGTSI